MPVYDKLGWSAGWCQTCNIAFSCRKNVLINMDIRRNQTKPNHLHTPDHPIYKMYLKFREME